MKKFLVVVMLLPMVVLGQNPTEIPWPVGVPTDYSMELYFNTLHQFYDFDGDGHKDAVVSYYNVSSTPRYYFQFYSYSKKQTIATIPIETYYNMSFEDLDGDSLTEMIFTDRTNNKTLIYEITTAIGIKKKLP